MSGFRFLLAQERRRQRGRLAIAAACASIAATASVVLFGLSGWFISSAALAGAGGLVVAGAFNYLLPSAAIRLLAIARTGCRYTERISGHDAALRALARVRPALFRGLAAAPAWVALNLSTGEAVARMTQDVDEVEAGFVRRSARWGAGTAVLVGALMAIPAGAACAAAALGSVVILVLAGRKLAALSTASGAAVAAANGALKQDMAALLAATQELRAHGKEDWAAGYAANRSRTLQEAQNKAARAAAWFEPLQATSAGAAAILVLVLAGSASLPEAALAGFSVLATIEAVAPHLRGLQRQGHLHAAERRLEASVQRPATIRPPVPLGAPYIRIAGLGPEWAPGTWIGLSGPSGCGKTSLIETLLGLRPARPYEICVAGQDISGLSPEQLRPLFSHAPQDASLLAGTVRENLLLAHPAADDAALWKALHDAVLDRRIAALPGGLDCWIGEGGLRLSGGERRRLSLARAYLRPAPWLLLDEPTEGLDTETEALVVARMRDRLSLRRQGALIVSHRAAPLALCTDVWRLPKQAQAVIA